MNSDAIEISGNGFRYPAFVGRGLIAKAGEIARRVIDRNRCAIIADQTSARLFGDRVSENFSSKKFSSKLITIAAGEKSKSLAQVEKICDEMIKAGFDRSSFVVGLGGGVIGDISGFVAAIFQRGIPHIQIPTTLLAMVDSSIGGKTGVNLQAGKNLVGVIHHPALIICDVDALENLPPQDLRQGYAEIIKHAIIRDAEMFRDLSSRAQVEGSRGESLKGAQRDPSSSLRSAWDDKMVELIRRNIAIKARIVSVDDRETSGERALLNFGHTVGHAIESAAGCGELLHGEALSLGMIAAAHVSVRRAGLSPREFAEIRAALEAHHLPTALPPDFPRAKIFEALPRDKKFVNGRIRFVVAHAIGHASITGEVTMGDLEGAVAAL